MAPSCTRTRSPLRKEGAQSCVMTRVVPSSMTRVMRYMRSDPTELPVAPEVPVEPVVPVPAVDVAPVRGTTSMRVTRLLGVAVEAVELPAWLVSPVLLAVLPVLPVLPVTLLLPEVPAMAPLSGLVVLLAEAEDG